MEFDPLTPSWYVLHTKSRFENVVFDGLVRKHVDAFLPKIKVRSRRRDRRVMIEVPLFPGYVFVKTDLYPHHHLDILKTAGAVRLIGTKGGPVPVEEDTVESLKIMVTSSTAVSAGNQLKKGDRVVVVSGPLTGVTGTFVRYRGKERVIVNVEALGQHAGVDVDEKDVERLPDILS